jgi:murein DD-endopeptidase MepM/ murein hydrolase activator NlpD
MTGRWTIWNWCAGAVVGVGLAAMASLPVAAAPCWRPPVAGVVVDPFREPTCTWCPGNRGLEYAVDADATVNAVAAGTVTFAGVVVDTRYVVVQLPSGWLLTYGRLDASSLALGDRVLTGTPIGRASGNFFFGVRIDKTHVDPARFLGRQVGRHRLVPLDGSPPRPAPPPRVSCHVERERR